MRKWRALGAAMILTSLVVGTSATTSASTTSNVSCATQVVSTWTLPRLANETISVSVNAANIGAMGPAARAGYGGLLLLGTTAPTKFANIVATLQRERPDKYAMLIMSDEEGGGVTGRNSVGVGK